MPRGADLSFIFYTIVYQILWTILPICLWNLQESSWKEKKVKVKLLSRVRLFATHGL